MDGGADPSLRQTANVHDTRTGPSPEIKTTGSNLDSMKAGVGGVRE